MPTLLFVGPDLSEAEGLGRLLRARVGALRSPAEACAAVRTHGAPDVLFLDDRAWPAGERDALEELRALSASRRLAVVLSRRRGEAGEPSAHAVVQRPYRLDEVVSAVRAALLRRP